MTYHFRLITAQDIPILAHHRRQMFSDMGHADHPNMEGMVAAFQSWAAGAIERGYYTGFVAEHQGTAVAGLGLTFPEFPPRLQNLLTIRPYIFNIYTEPAHRRKGLARKLLEMALVLCHQRGATLVALHASADGRALYESLGFKLNNEMVLQMEVGSG